MGIKFTIKYHEKVILEDIVKLSAVDKNRMKIAIENKLLTEPEIFGIPLRKSLKGYRKLRVGDYRVIFIIEKRVIKIFAIQHRSVIYNHVSKRFKS